MIKNKNLISAMILAGFILAAGTAGCSDRAAADTGGSNAPAAVTEEKTAKNESTGSSGSTEGAGSSDSSKSSAAESPVKTEEELDKEFDAFIGGAKTEEGKNILKDLLKKAYAYCGSGFYVETAFDGGINGSGIGKEYWQDGNYRFEQYNGSKLEYLTVYNKGEDICYEYEAKRDVLKKITKCTQKKQKPEMYKYGFFPMINVINANFKTIDYEGKKVLYAQAVFNNKTKDGIKEKNDNEYWYDAETGIMIKYQQKLYNNGKLYMTYSNKYTVRPNQKFDEAVFKYDPNNKEAGNLKK